MASEDLLVALDKGTQNPSTPLNGCGQALLLKGGPVVTKLTSWCWKHNKSRHGVKPTLAVVYFDTGDDADEYLYIKAVVARRAGIEYIAHKLLPDALLADVLDKIAELNDDDGVHGILIQRPVPEHLCEQRVMNSVAPLKHIEEYTRGKANNIALDGLIRLLNYYQEGWMLSLNIILLGGTNIITPGFKAELKRRYKYVTMEQTLEASMANPKHESIIITELNKGGIIKPGILGPAIRLVVDLGFDVDTKTGDVDPDVLDMDGLVVVPTPGGVLPVLLWIMMERTIKARNQMVKVHSFCIPPCTAS